MRKLDRKLYRDLWHMRGQVTAVALVVACGIAVFVAMLSVYDSLLLTRDEYYERHRLADVFASLERAPMSLLARLASIAGVTAVEDRVVRDVSVDVPGLEEPATAHVVSVPESGRPVLNALYLREGRWIEPGAADEVIASEAFAEANRLGPGDRIGAVIGGRWQMLRIVGIALSPEFVYELQPGVALFADNRRYGVLWMGREAMNAAFGMSGAFNDVAIAIARDVEPRGVVAGVDNILARYGCAQAYARKDQLSYAMINEELKQLRANGIYLPAIFIAIAAFLLNIVLARLIALQRDQIAILKAFGYRNGAVGVHYLAMCIAIVLIGAVVGVAGGYWIGSALTEVYAAYYHFPFLRYRLDPSVIALATGASIVAGGAGAWGAVMRAVALPPAEAMRPEGPARFRPGLLERMGFESFLPSSARMVLRNFERAPWKALISVLGISVAVGILVLGRFATDSIQFMSRLQFREIQREDVVAVFTSPRSPSAVAAIASFPGVLRVEPYRMLAVRLHAAHRTRTIAIQGMEPTAELRRIIDDEHTVHRPDPDGLTLTTKLGEILGVDVGDTVIVELLEGERRMREVRVADLAREVLGLSAYMSRDAVDRLAGRPAVSGAYLLIDGARRQELYRMLKRTPAVAGAMIRETTIEGFDRTVAESQNISRLVVTIAAAVIAIGIIYNSARIALSERGRELASLRVLGFTKAEVSTLLLGEQAIIIALGIPLGYVVGYGFCVLISLAYEAEMYRLPVVVSLDSFVYATFVAIAAGVAAGLLVRRRIRSLDLIEVLKTRE
jgi:putative ABC transport system permease protein